MAEEQAPEIVSGTDGPNTPEGALKAAKAKFHELVAKQAGEPDLTKPFSSQTTPSGERGKKPKKAPQKLQEATEEEVEVGAQVEAKPPQADPAKRSEADKFRAKLLLAGNPKKAIESLSDDEVGGWWKKQEEREQAAASALQRASELEKRFAPETSKKSEPLAGVPTDELDLEEITDALTDQFGEEEAGAIAKVFSAMIAPIRQENREIKTILEGARNHGIQQIEKSNRERLGEQLPMLKTNDRAWAMLNAAVQEELKKDPKKYSSAEGVFDDVFQGVYGEMVAEKAAVAASEVDETAEEKARIAASSHTPPTSAKRRQAFTPMDAHKAAFEHLQKNPDDTEGARRSYGRFLVQ